MNDYRNAANIKFKTAAIAGAIAAGLAAANPAYAQVLQPVVNASALIANTVTAVALGLMTIAVTVAGYKIMFAGANFRDVSNLLIGGAVSGGAAAIAALF
jgi:type IV secretion system protein VirB2